MIFSPFSGRSGLVDDGAACLAFARNIELVFIARLDLDAADLCISRFSTFEAIELVRPAFAFSRRLPFYKKLLQITAVDHEGFFVINLFEILLQPLPHSVFVQLIERRNFLHGVAVVSFYQPRVVAVLFSLHDHPPKVRSLVRKIIIDRAVFNEFEQIR